MPDIKQAWIVSPCFFDIQSFLKVRSEVVEVFKNAPYTFQPHFILIDDSAGRDPEVSLVQSQHKDVTVVTPPYNLGHQGALVYALRDLGSKVDPTDLVVTMDSDGEDKPQDIPLLIERHLKNLNNIYLTVLARRTQRKESLIFKLFYKCYRLFFRILTGTVIINGNFAAYRGWLLKEVIFHPHFDQCYTSTFVSLPLQIEMVPIARGERYFGKTKMGWMGLFSHGFRSLMPFTERVAVRGLVLTGSLILASLLASAFFFFNHNIILVVVFLSCTAFCLQLFTMLGILFATFSQTKSRSLRELNELAPKPRS